MNAWIDTISNFIRSSNFADVFLDAALKSFVVLAIAGGACLCWRRVSAATRHVIWFLAVSSLLWLPLLSPMMSSWHRPLWFVSSGLNSANEISLALELAPVKETATSVRGQQIFPATEPTAPDHHRFSNNRVSVRFGGGWLVFALVVWCGGTGLALISVVIGQLRLGSLSRKACPLQDSEWKLLLKEACEKLRLRRGVALLQSADSVMPLTWGWRRPVVLLPAEAAQWPEGRRRVVLLHELAHVKRWDCLTQSVARIVCAFYWFNPLVWLAARRMCIEREGACDDLVLTSGCRASNYASHLVAIAKEFRPVPQVAAIAMARASGLERRVTAILDNCRCRNRIAKMAVALIAAAIVALGMFVGSHAQESTPESWSLERSKVANQLKRFVAEKRTQAIAGAKAEGREMLPEYAAMFAAAAKGDWNSISNIWEDLRGRAPQYQSNGSKEDPRLHGTPWQTMLEIWSGFGNIIVGGEDHFVSFANDVITSIPPGSIYFGGTDPGRCVITALQKSHVNADPFFTLTQNALADGTYLQYLRGMYGGRIYPPTDEDAQKCFQEYLADAQRRLGENKLKPGEDVNVVDGRVQVSGQVAVMSINGLLTKIIFDKNPEREFFIEESFPLDWMYPHLEPRGLIMKINRQPVAELSEELVQRDRAHWRGPVADMIGNWLELDTPVKTLAEYAAQTYAHEDPKKFAGSKYIPANSANKWLSKLRSSIGGLYAWRAQHASSESEKARMIREADFAFRQAWAICPYSPEAVFRYVQLLVSQNRTSDALLVAETAASIDEHNGQLRDLIHNLKESQQAR